jgi:hypothetical protein
VIFSVWRRIRDRKAWKSSRRREKLYRICLGPGKNYRAIYQIQDEVLIVLVVKVGDRKDVYRRSADPFPRAHSLSRKRTPAPAISRRTCP